MGYMKIENLYKNTEIIDLFKECYALEKIHGTSAHVKFKADEECPEGRLAFFSGGEKHENFTKLWDHEDLTAKFREFGPHTLWEGITFFGEAYGGSQQGMSATYGKELKFIVFDVKIGDLWLSVPKAAKVAEDMGFEFVHWVRGPANLEFLNEWRDADSTQAIRNGVGEGKKREGVVIRPLIELRKNNGKRLINKHKREDFSEVRTTRKVGVDLEVLTKAREIAQEWVTPMRMVHVLDKLRAGGIDTADIKSTGQVVRAMIEDVRVESEGEVVWSREAEKEIGKAAARYFKQQVTAIPPLTP
jgi:hypothetical protein